MDSIAAYPTRGRLTRTHVKQIYHALEVRYARFARCDWIGSGSI